MELKKVVQDILYSVKTVVRCRSRSGGKYKSEMNIHRGRWKHFAPIMCLIVPDHSYTIHIAHKHLA